MTRNCHAIAASQLLVVAATFSSFATQAAAGTGNVSAASSSQSLPSSSAGTAISDAAITSKVKVKLLGSEQMTGASINVTTDNGVVLLKGIVLTADMAEEATQIAQSVDGVKSVDNQLSTPASTNRVAARSSATPSSEVANELDSRINLKVRDRLLTDSELKDAQIGITTIDSVVRLFGQVQTEIQKDRAALVARQVEGVKGVDASALTVAPGP